MSSNSAGLCITVVLLCWQHKPQMGLPQPWQMATDGPGRLELSSTLAATCGICDNTNSLSLQAVGTWCADSVLLSQ